MSTPVATATPTPPATRATPAPPTTPPSTAFLITLSSKYKNMSANIIPQASLSAATVALQI